MSDKFKIRDIDKAYFVTLTVVGWIDVFTRLSHKLLDRLFKVLSAKQRSGNIWLVFNAEPFAYDCQGRGGAYIIRHFARF